MPPHGKILLILFVLTALFESFDRIAGDFKSSVKDKKVKMVFNIVEVYVLFALITGAIIFILVDDPTKISITAVVCSSLFFIIKVLRMGRILNFHLLG
jgi:hypothetical protein